MGWQLSPIPELRSNMRLYTLEREQRVPAALERVFPFFERPENLERLTPPSMNMRILTPQPVTMRSGALIDYVVTVGVVPMRWTTYIADYDPPHRFVDVQLRGPYSFWHHTHTFEAAGDETVIRDRVVYALPFGPIGRIAHALFVKRQLDGIFSFRQSYLDQQVEWSPVISDATGATGALC
jgi:ligand-binding SRPBCC domain-containing protein